jgi:hypothetical protein
MRSYPFPPRPGTFSRGSRNKSSMEGGNQGFAGRGRSCARAEIWGSGLGLCSVGPRGADVDKEPDPDAKALLGLPP